MYRTNQFDEAFFKNDRTLSHMRRSIFLMILFSTSVFAPLSNAEPPTDGSTLNVPNDETWSSGGTLDGTIIVEDGATLTISSNYIVEEGSTIVVEQGATLDMIEGASLESTDVSAGRMLTLGSQLHLNFGDVADTGLLQIHLDAIVPSTAEFNATLDTTTVDVAALDSKIIEFNDVPLDGTLLNVTFSIYTFADVKVTKVIAIYDGEQSQLVAEEMNTTNANLWWYNAAFNVIVHGDFSMSDGELRGGNITCHGTCTIDGSSLVGSAPVEVPSTGSLSVTDSSIFGSRADEDIILYDDAEISYINSNGTGGFTDAWVRLLSSRTLYTNIPNGSIDIMNLGYGDADWNDLTDEQGVLILVEEGGNEHRRMIEWMDSSGVVHQEDGTITLSISSNWGNFATTIPAPTTPVGYLNLSLPYIVVDSVEPSEVTGSVNKSIGLMLTVSNNGQADATANFRCYVNGEDADTAPSTITVSLDAGNTTKVPISWWANTDGAQQLTCKPFLPTLLEPIADLVVDVDGATSDEVSWTYAEESEDAPLIIYAVVVLGFVGLGFFISRKKTPPEI